MQTPCSTKSVDTVPSQVGSTTQSDSNIENQSCISPEKYISYNPSLHVYSEQFYRGYDVFPPNLNNWSGYTPQSHFVRHMSNASVSDFFHHMAYP